MRSDLCAVSFGWILFVAMIAVGCGADEQRGIDRNLGPAIDELSSSPEPEEVRPGEPVTLTVRAYDRDDREENSEGEKNDASAEGGDGGFDGGATGEGAGMDAGATGDAGTAGLPEGLEASWAVSNDEWTLEAEEGATTTLDPPDRYETQTEVTVTVADEEGATVSESIEFTLGENERPRIEQAIAEPNRVEPTDTIALSADATDENGDDLTYQWSVSEGWMLDEETGQQVDLTAPDEDDASGRVELEVADGYGGTASTSLQVGTTDNSPPSIASMNASPPQVDPGAETTVVVDASDPDGDELAYEWSAPTGWEVDSESGEATVTAPSTHGAEATISVSVSDTRGHEVTGRVVVSTTTNEGPTIGALTATPQQVDRGGTIDLEVEADDPDGQMLNYEWSVDGGDWTVAGNGETATLTAPQTPGVSTQVSVTVTDDDDVSASSSIVVSTAPNEAPSLSSVTASPSTVEPGGNSTLEATASDPDGDDLSYEWNAPADWNLQANGSEAEVTAPDTYGASGTISVSVEDEFGGETSGSVTVSTVRNQPPTISGVVANPPVVSKNGSTSVSVSASDPNGDPLSYSWNVVGSDWTINGSGDSVTVEAPDRYGASTTVEVTAEDDRGASTTGTAILQTESNDSPTVSATAADRTLPRQGQTDVTANASDPNGDTLTYDWSVPADWSKSGSGDQITVTAPDAYDASAQIEVTVEDGNGGTATDAAVVQTESNDAPSVSVAATQTTLEPQGQTDVIANASDPNGDTLSYDWSVPGDWSKNGSGDEVTITAPDTYDASARIEVTVEDGFGGSATASIGLRTEENSPPVVSVSSTKATLDPGEDTTLSASASDPEGDSLTYDWNLPSDWSGSSSTDTLVATAPRAYGRDFDLAVEVSDGFNTTTETVTVTMVDNQDPVVDSLDVDPNPVLTDGDVNATVTASDSLGDSLSYGWNVDNGDWSISGSGDSVTVSAPSNDSTTELTVTVSDGYGGTASSSTTLEAYELIGDGTDSNPYRDAALYASCQDYLDMYPSSAGDGLYKLEVNGTTFKAYCDMTRDGGGWTLTMQAQDNQPSNNSWCQSSGYNVPTNPEPSNQTFKYSNSRINAIRGSDGIYRLDGDGSNQHFFKSHTYEHNRDIQNESTAYEYWDNPQFNGTMNSSNITNGTGRGLASDHGGSYQTNHNHGDCYMHTDGGFARMWVR